MPDSASRVDGGAGGLSAAGRVGRCHSRPARGRLSRSADFDRVVRQGRSHAGRELVLYVFPRSEEGLPRLGLSVSRRVGGAVQRNRLKRLLRDAFALESARLPAACDAVVVARQDARGLAEREGLHGIRRALAELVSRAAGEGGRDARAAYSALRAGGPAAARQAQAPPELLADPAPPAAEWRARTDGDGQ